MSEDIPPLEVSNKQDSQSKSMIFPQDDPQDHINEVRERAGTTTEMTKMQSSDILESKLPDESALRKMVMDAEAIEDVIAKSLEESMRDNDGNKKSADPNDTDISQSMVCEKHKAPASFFSHKEERYVCFKCLVSQEQLLFIDKRYKEHMDDFERIKTLTAKAIQSNFINTTTIKRWKYEIRECLMRIRSKFIDQIDAFIQQFGNVFKNVEMSTELLEFKGEDNKMLT